MSSDKRKSKTPAAKPKEYKIAQFFAIRAISGLALSPNGKTIAYITNTSGSPNIWTIPIEGGWASQITLEENAVSSIVYSPKNSDIIFQTDNKGDENFQIYMVSDKGGEVKNLTPSHAGSQTIFCAFNKKGNKILFSSNKRDKRFFDTYVVDLKTGTEECIASFDDIYPFIASDWSKDEKKIVYHKHYNNSDSDIFLYDTQTKEMLNITRHEGDMKNSSGMFNKKNDKYYFISDYKREFNTASKPGRWDGCRKRNGIYQAILFRITKNSCFTARTRTVHQGLS
ncbi:MAG TPA: hypothetical protein PKA39_06890 [Ignavibacteria bacterium]|nr:hypothetical protein [Ignavibacteria bacterium]